MRTAVRGVAQFFPFHKFLLGLVRKAISGGLPVAVGSWTLTFPKLPVSGEMQWGEDGVRSREKWKTQL